MTDNRRNHYRVLHVQPDAPTEVIKASWRTMMSRLRQHPDLGGSHAQAAMVNQAWQVLGDVDRRAAYDSGLRQGLAAVPTVHPTERTAASRPAPLAPAMAAAAHACPLCRLVSGAPIRSDSRCAQCQSPLALLPDPSRLGHELLGRRGAVRRDQGHVALVHVGWPSPALPVRWRDLSLTGLSFYAPQPMPRGQRLRLIDAALEGVVEVVGCRAQGRVHAVHARLLTGLLLQATGVFVSAQA